MRRNNFGLLWLGQAVSELGSAVTALALPLTAVVTLRASAFEVGVLAALGVAGWVVVSLPAGVLVDRVPDKRLLMVVCDAGRLAVVLALPVFAATTGLAIWHLWAAAALLGVLTVVFEVGYWSLIPAVLAKDELVGAHGKIASTHAAGLIAGPALAGGLVAALGSAVKALLLDAATFVVSLVSLLLMRVPRVRTRSEQTSVLAELREGLHFVWRHPVLRRIVIFASANGLFDGMAGSLVVLYLLRDLSTAPGIVGAVLAAGAAGAGLGGLLAPGLSRRMGSARLLWLAPLVCGAGGLLLVLAQPGGLVLAAAGMFLPAAGMVIFHVLQISYRQSICPPRLQGRMNASVRWIIRSGRPVGALLAGTLGGAIGIRPTLLIGVLGAWLCALLLLAPPLLGRRDLP